ncbi:HupE/UreJ family protein [Paenibacillus sp. MBLB4367]|uniref:HupE/UreJ family protein n=1 Tax=Paenibacillus sp. MBLB4367 TaxID=3384767 RepID=UPI0039080B33
MDQAPPEKKIRLLGLIPLILATILAGTFAFLPQEASAHPLNNGYSTLTLAGNKLDYELFIPEPSLLTFDSDHDGRVVMEELSQQHNEIAAYIGDNVKLTGGGEDLSYALLSMEKTDRETIPGVRFHLVFTGEDAISSFTVHYNLLFDDIDPLHLSFLTILDNGDVDQYVLETDDRWYHYESLHPQTALTVLWRYFELGVEHILTGYDHLLFLFALILISARFKDALVIVTAFTVAHSVTLFLAATGRINLPGVWIESAIALSIAYVAAENIVVRSSRFRWGLTFLFGLIHGMGFAGALAETGLPATNVVGTLLAFNAGVETGQLAIVLLALPLLLRLRRFVWYPRLVTGLSVMIGGVAVYWFAERIGWIG